MKTTIVKNKIKGFVFKPAAKIVHKIRLYQPKIILCNATKDRHPDHSVASKLVSKSCFISGLSKFVRMIFS